MPPGPGRTRRRWQSASGRHSQQSTVGVPAMCRRSLADRPYLDQSESTSSGSSSSAQDGPPRPCYPYSVINPHTTAARTSRRRCAWIHPHTQMSPFILLLHILLLGALCPGGLALSPEESTARAGVSPSSSSSPSPPERVSSTGGDGVNVGTTAGPVGGGGPSPQGVGAGEERPHLLDVTGPWRPGAMPGCARQPLPARYAEWTGDVTAATPVVVRWTYGNETCNSYSSCFGTGDPTLIEPQLLPVQVQPGVKVRFVVDVGMDTNFTIRPFWVAESNFRSCDVTGGIPIIARPAWEEFEVQPEYLRPGSNYFIVETDPIFRCEYGLRLNVTVKSDRCQGPGEPLRCWGRGRCVSAPIQPFFECACCHGYTGRHCEDVDACASSPCEGGGTCVDEPGDPTGERFTCVCPRGLYGPTCSQVVENQCNTLPCENNGTCSGNSTHYRCECLPGYHGWHCEINVNECASNPCQHGVCVDRFNGFQCFCIPGHGGTLCEKEYDECQSNPCKNGGFCIDKEDGWECHCGRGYTGTNCHMKVDLCDPSPCSNATDCVDYGNTFTCTCNPGFTGLHCEININECGSSPCQNGGRCYDQVAGYKCMCTPGHTGPHCEHTIQALLPKPPGAGSMYRLSHHHSHLHNLSIIAGTLAGALLIALSVLAGCYCRLYGTYHLFNFRQFKYKRQTEANEENKTDSEKAQQVDVSDNRPNVNAILEATSSGSGYRDNNLNAPLMHSLKARRI